MKKLYGLVAIIYMTIACVIAIYFAIQSGNFDYIVVSCIGVFVIGIILLTISVSGESTDNHDNGPDDEVRAK